MIASADIERMSLADRLQAMELLWRSLAQAPGSLESPPWHGQVLASRAVLAESGASRFLSLADAKARSYED